MSSGSEKYRDEALRDVVLFRDKPPSRQLLAESRKLTRLVLYSLGVDGDVSDYCRSEVLGWLLPELVNDVRERAFNSLVPGVRRGNDPVFQAAAATELLKIRTPRFDEQYDRLKKELRKSPLGFSPAGNPGSVVAAAAWLGFTKGAIADEEKKIELYLAFVQELEGYLIRPKVRDEVRAMIEQYAQAAPNLKSPAVPPLQASAAAEVKYARPITPELRDILIDLADQVKEQLREERATNRVGRAAAFPLPRKLIRDEQYVDDPRNVADKWGIGPNDSRWESAQVNDLVELVSTAPCARLVLLGQGGAGKSTLAASIALKVLESDGRLEVSPVPVIFQLSSWNPHKQPDLNEWLAKKLITEYHALKRVGRRKESWAKRLVDGGHIMPVLDGFDEIEGLVRPAALWAINNWVERENSVVLLSRGQEYFHAVAVNRPLVGAAVVEMQNAELGAVEEYLGRTTNRSAEWADVFAQVKLYSESNLSAVLRSVLTTPLMAMLAGAVYDLADGSESEERRSPIELLDAKRFSSIEALTEHLLDAFVQVRLAPRFIASDSKRARVWDHEDARKWLGFLAAALVVEKTSDFCWWKPGKVFDAAIETILGLLAFGAITAGIFAFVSTDSISEALGHPAGIFTALYIASFAFHLIISNLEPPVLAWHFDRSGKSSWSKSSTSGLIGFDLSIAMLASLMIGASQGSFIAFLVALAISSAGLYFLPPALVERQSPPALLRADRVAVLIRCGFISGPLVMWSLVSWVVTRRTEYLDAISGVVVFIGFTALSSASTLWLLRSSTLATRGRLPWRTMLFLRDAHRRGVLRQSGGVYQFRHAALLGYLAEEHVNNLPGQWAFIDPDHAQSLLIVSKFWSGTYDQADEKLRQLITDHEDSKEFGKANEKRLLLVEILRKKGQLKEAVEQLEAYQSDVWEVRFGRNLENQLLLVELLAELGDDAQVYVESERLWREIAKQNHWYKGMARDEAQAMMVRLREHPLFEIRDES
ncbi:NACHT domain-containing protein [Umezawaea sp. Da 62-37]|uniref:NACHT domain-containing protein n=1 Tax=Umezawaea sp. Da 62-37 TaxID=3075927 RepID=UPI0028F73596|nr:NACHT domain-containing protein [Umezawaea sp. Da 62-37]WNV83476.1 NACHT domain-containing protein [Umezawaea sp. Da 62-37]